MIWYQPDTQRLRYQLPGVDDDGDSDSDSARYLSLDSEDFYSRLYADLSDKSLHPGVFLLLITVRTTIIRPLL